MSSFAVKPGPSSPLQRYITLLEVGDVIHACRDADDLFGKLAELLRKVVSFDAIAVGLLEDDGENLRLALLETWVEQQVEIGFTVPLNAVPGGWVMEHQKPIRVRVNDNDPRFQLHNEVMKRAGFGVSFHLPLTTALSRLGEVVFSFREEVELPSVELEFMQRVADQVALAIENAKNFEQARRVQSELQHRYQQRDVLLKLVQSVLSHLELSEVLQAVVTGVRKVVPSDVAVVALPDKECLHMRVEAMDFPEANGLFQRGMQVPIDGSMAGKCFRRKGAIVANYVDPKNYTEEMYQRVVGEELQTQCFVPFVSHDRALGVLGLARREKKNFSEDEVEFLGHVANQIAIALENAFNYEAARGAEQERSRERDRLQLLMDVTNRLASNLELGDLLQAVATSVRQVMLCDFASVHLPIPEGTHLKAYALDFPGTDWNIEKIEAYVAQGRGTALERYTPIEGSFHGDVFKSGKPFSTARLDPAQYPREAAFLASQGLSGGCIIPMILRGRVVGNLALGRRAEIAFTADEIDFLMQFGAQVALAIENALAYGEISKLKERLAQEKLYLEDEIRSEFDFEEIIGQSAALREVLRLVNTVAASDSTVLLLGETGTGKEVIARAVHEHSRRKDRTFVKLNCAAIPTGLLESELFGHEKGAFTGAIAQKIGRLELADNGTLFLDEVGDIPIEIQPKLLRALQEREFERLGSTHTKKVNVRLIAATNRDLEKMIADRQFRSDLYYRLNVFPIRIPPLRERPDDVPLLVRYFTEKFSRQMQKHIDSIPAASMNHLKAWHWPGNVRELENLIERSVILTSNTALQIPLAGMETGFDGAISASPYQSETSERDQIIKMLRETRGVLAGPNGAASRLGVKRTTLQYKMKKLGITRDHWWPNLPSA